MDIKYPSIKQAVILIILIAALMFIFGITLGVIIATFNLYEYTTLLSSFINLFAIGIFLLRAIKKTNKPFFELYPFESTKMILLVPIILIALGLNIIFSEIDNITRSIYPAPEYILNIFYNIFETPNISHSFFYLCIVAPLTEELLFRGLILQSFLNQYSKRKAIIISSLLFAILHINPWQFICTFIGGVLLSILFINQKSLFPCFIAHSIYNFLPILLLRISNLKISGYTTDPSPVIFQPLWFNFLGIFLLLTGLYLSSKLFKSEHIMESNSTENIDAPNDEL